MTMMSPRKELSRMGISQVQRRVDQMQYRENRAMTTLTTALGFPSQMRVADSRSYFRITSFMSAAVPISTSGRFFLSFSLIESYSLIKINTTKTGSLPY